MKRRLLPLTAASLTLAAGLLATTSPAVRADDGIFPSSPAAAPFIDFDGKGFLIRGQREFLVSGSLHYPRVPRALWRDRLLRMKRAGFNCVQTYAFWNFHEPREGEWNFSDDHDLDAFLKLTEELGMYATVRVGPYVCAEWDSGGWPVWLRFKPGVRVREDNTEYLKYLDKWYDRVLPIVARHQIHKGGSVILVQLENEHPQGWGMAMPNAYFTHLRDSAVEHGIEVPYFFSGLHHGSDPAGNRSWDSEGRTNPWYTTEFWPGWFDLYGPLSPDNQRRFDRGTWKIIAYGGNGYNYYMVHGGTNFDSFNNDEDASSYDYAAAIGQAGDLRPIYYRFKRAAYFARSFPLVLENSTNADKEYAGVVASASGIRVTARKSDSGTIVFLDNPGREPITTAVRLDTGASDAPSLTIAPGEIVPVLKNCRLTDTVTINGCVGRVLGVTRQNKTTTAVLYGPPDSLLNASLQINGAKQVTVSGRSTGDKITSQPLLVGNGSAVQLSLTVPGTAAAPRVFTLQTENEQLRFVVVSDYLADRTWFVDAASKTWIAVGPDYVGEAVLQNKSLHLMTENALLSPSSYGRTDMFAPEGGDSIPVPLIARMPDTPGGEPHLGEWRVIPATEEAAPGFKDGKWTGSDAVPLQMGADGDPGAYAWYRGKINAPRAGTYALRFADAGDRVTVFVNGARIGETTIRRRGRSPVSTTLENVSLPQGESTLAVFAAHYGRDKLFNWLGPIDQVAAKGLNGTVSLGTAPDRTVSITEGWQWRTVASTPEAAPPPPETAGWQSGDTRADVFQGRRGFAWYRVSLPPLSGGNRRLHFENVDDDATVFLNGVKVGAHQGWGDAFDLSVDAAWHESGQNELAILVRNTDGAGGIMGPVSLTAGGSAGIPVTGWKMHGGIREPNAKGDTLSKSAFVPGSGPAWFSTTLDAPAYSAEGPHPIYRVTTKGLSAGFVYLNGHNLGRYPERIPVNGIYLPECWLKPGSNDLRFFDEEGRLPTEVQIVREDAASRTILTVQATPDKEK